MENDLKWVQHKTNKIISKTQIKQKLKQTKTQTNKNTK